MKRRLSRRPARTVGLALYAALSHHLGWRRVAQQLTAIERSRPFTATRSLARWPRDAYRRWHHRFAEARATTTGQPVSEWPQLLAARWAGRQSRQRAVLGPRTLAHYGWRKLRDEYYLMKGRRILWRYSAHYRQAQRVYRRAYPSAAPPALPVRDVGVRVLTPRDTSWLRLPAHHADAVARVAASVDDALAQSANCRFVPRLSSSPVPQRTAALEELAEARLITIQLRAPLSLDGLAELCEPLLAQLEEKLFVTFTIVDKVYAYRSPISRQEPSASWIWHFDNHPCEMLKVMVYLTDVSEETAPFEYIRHRVTKQPLMGEPLAPLHRPSRVAPEEIDRRLADGYEAYRITGPRGTVVVFDDNVVHRGTLARGGHRDVVVFQVRPATFEARPHIDPRWTGSFLHQDVNRDPADVTPHLKQGNEPSATVSRKKRIQTSSPARR